jgi:hypothetical protein
MSNITTISTGTPIVISNPSGYTEGYNNGLLTIRNVIVQQLANLGEYSSDQINARTALLNYINNELEKTKI